MPTERVTVTLPPDLLADVDRRSRNRSLFIQDAVRHELLRLRREELQRSLRSPHPESVEVAELGLSDWSARVTEEDVAGLLDPEAGVEVRWQPGEGWTEVEP